MICTVMYGNGAVIGTVPIQEMLQIRWDRHLARTACTVAAVVTTTRRAAVLRSGSAVILVIAASALGFASPLSQFNDWKSFFLLATA